MRNEEIFIKSNEYMPGGVNSPVRAYRDMGINPPVMKSGKGVIIKDEDGKEYIDFVLAWGPMILGHCNDEVVTAIKEISESAIAFGAPTELELQMAKFLCEEMDNVEMVRFVNSGTEATMSALRVARGYTGRDKIVKFIGCYHGHADSLLVKAGSGAATFGQPDSPGVTKGTAKDTITVPYNDIEAFVNLMNEQGDEIAAVIVEPVAGNMGLVLPKQGFLSTLRKETEKHGTVLIFDEVMCGFRVALNGAQAAYGIRPDLTCLGKIIGGGLPVAAYGGKREIMDCVSPKGPVYQAGTLSGNPLAMTAGIATLDIISADPAWGKADYTRELSIKTKHVLQGFAKAAKDAGVKVQLHQAGSMFGVFFNENDVYDYATSESSDQEAFGVWFMSMLEQGIYLAPSQFETLFMSGAHSDDDIVKTIDAAEVAMKKVAEFLNNK